MKRWSWIALAALCMLNGSTWLPQQAFTTTWPTLFRLCFHDGIVAICLSSAAIYTRNRSFKVLVEVGVWGTVIFALPVILAAVAGGAVSSSTELLVLGLVPFLTVFLVAQRIGGEMRLLVPALAGLGGLALLAEFSLPNTLQGILCLGLMVVSAGVTAFGGSRLHTILRSVPILHAAAAASLATAVAALVAWKLLAPEPVAWDWRSIGVETSWAICIDLPLALLMVWLFREMRPVGFATRFLLIPLVTVVEGMLVMRPTVLWTTWLGLALLAGASLVLLRERNDEVVRLNGRF